MHQVHNFPNNTILAHAAADHAIETLGAAIAQNGRASWVLAGGSTPNLAYAYIAERHLQSLDWSNVTFILGDERIGPLDSSSNNWHGIYDILLRHLPQATHLRPQSHQSAEAAAAQYQQQLQSVAQFDLVWLGMGEDGHTLSLFPEHANFTPSSTELVVPVYDSPKPPSDRITLTLHALERAATTVILASGEGKSEALRDALRPASTLPIAQAARTTGALWYIDAAAATKLT